MCSSSAQQMSLISSVNAKPDVRNLLILYLLYTTASNAVLRKILCGDRKMWMPSLAEMMTEYVSYMAQSLLDTVLTRSKPPLVP